MPLAEIQSRVRRLTIAAARLSAFYALGVTALLALLILWGGEWSGNIAGVLWLMVNVLARATGISFALLWLLRRIGLHALWLGLIAIWISGPLQWIPVGVLAGFVFWSVLALPLYVMTVMGFPPALSASARGVVRNRSFAVLVVWLALLCFTLAITPPEHLALGGDVLGAFDEPPAAILKLARFIWGPLPILIALDSIARIGIQRSLRPERLAASVETSSVGLRRSR